MYAVAPHTGRGGWSWYTGSAGWMYRLMLESLLGLDRVGNTLRVVPCLPRDWTGFVVRYRVGAAQCRIEVVQVDNDDDAGLWVDGSLQPDARVPLVDDGAEHVVTVRVVRTAT